MKTCWYLIALFISVPAAGDDYREELIQQIIDFQGSSEVRLATGGERPSFQIELAQDSSGTLRSGFIYSENSPGGIHMGFRYDREGFLRTVEFRGDAFHTSVDVGAEIWRISHLINPNNSVSRILKETWTVSPQVEFFRHLEQQLFDLIYHSPGSPDYIGEKVEPEKEPAKKLSAWRLRRSLERIEQKIRRALQGYEANLGAIPSAEYSRPETYPDYLKRWRSNQRNYNRTVVGIMITGSVGLASPLIAGFLFGPLAPAISVPIVAVAVAIPTVVMSVKWSRQRNEIYKARVERMKELFEADRPMRIMRAKSCRGVFF